ncbi:hypothetical protein MWH03_00310 [Klebsiella pneumoniae]|nr:hypothetical protein [Klebsiella pneumoniae]
MAKHIAGFKQTSSEQFFAYVNPRDIVIASRGSWKDGTHYQSFQTRLGKEVGRVYNHSAAVGQDEFFLEETLAPGAAR